MKHFALGLFTLLVATASFANSVNCYVDKETRYANGRPGNDIIVEMHIGTADSVRFHERGSSLITTIQREEDNNVTTVLVGEALNWNSDKFPEEIKELISLDVSGLLSSGKGNLSSESVSLCDGTRIHLRCEGKSE